MLKSPLLVIRVEGEVGEAAGIDVLLLVVVSDDDRLTKLDVWDLDCLLLHIHVLSISLQSVVGIFILLDLV